MDKRTNKEMNEYWNGDGGHKWVRFQPRMDASLKHFGHEVMEKAAISADNSVIDIGCGCGDTTFDIAQRVSPNGHVLGLDISEPILNQAMARKQSIQKQSNIANNITFISGDAQTHPFDAATLDIAFSRFGVMFFDDPIAAFSNIRSALKSGGRTAFVCWQSAEDNEWISLALDVVKNHIIMPAPAKPEQPGPLSFSDKNRVEHILKKAGFNSISIHAFETSLSVGSNLDEAVEFLTKMGPAGGVLFQPEVSHEDKAQISTELRQRLMPWVLRHGL